MSLPLVRIIIYVRDAASMKAFYVSHFGLPVIEEIAGEWVVLQAGNIELALHLAGERYHKVSAASTDQAPAVNTGATTKLVFTTQADLSAHRGGLRDAGVRVSDIKRYDGFPYAMYDGHDPEGNVFQVMRFD